jgi:hypothetical protein
MRFNTIRRWLARPFGHAKRQVETWLKGLHPAEQR